MRAIAFLFALSAPAAAFTAAFPICDGGPRITCVVEGDTVWFEGMKYRLAHIDTPEKGALAECIQEGLWASEATKRLTDILSTNSFTIEPEGRDRYGRVLVSFIVGQTAAGEC